MRNNTKKIFIIILTVTFLLVSLNTVKNFIYNKFYLNGNNEANIKRSILNLQESDIKSFENISIIKEFLLNERLIVIYENNSNYGVTEFHKNTSGDYKINYLQNGFSDEINFYTTMDMNNFIVYGDGNNIDFSRVDFGINNNYVPIYIPEEFFAEVINQSQYYNTNHYTYTYKYYDKNGNLVN